ncbi:MAG TPA: hypothetical protein V6D17_22070 [Candidatus Obscuribacterales bacterium]
MGEGQDIEGDLKRKDIGASDINEDDADKNGRRLILHSRRKLIQAGLFGLAAGGLDLIFPPDALPTEASGDLGAYGNYLQLKGKPKGAPSKNKAKGESAVKAAESAFRLTEDNILGPFYRENAPFRAKITPPLEPGKVLLVSGRVWGFDTRKPLSRCMIDIWQANANGRYDNDDPGKPPQEGVFLNRARLITDGEGAYEYETIHPGRYQIGPNVWRPSHIHYMVRCPGYKTLVTQLYFDGDPHNATDQFIKKSLIVKCEQQKTANGSYETARFDIVLAAAR